MLMNARIIESMKKMTSKGKLIVSLFLRKQVTSEPIANPSRA